MGKVFLISYGDVALRVILLYCSQMEWRELSQLSYIKIPFKHLMHGQSLHSDVELTDED